MHRGRAQLADCGRPVIEVGQWTVQGASQRVRRLTWQGRRNNTTLRWEIVYSA